MFIRDSCLWEDILVVVLRIAGAVDFALAKCSVAEAMLFLFPPIFISANLMCKSTFCEENKRRKMDEKNYRKIS